MGRNWEEMAREIGQNGEVVVESGRKKGRREEGLGRDFLFSYIIPLSGSVFSYFLAFFAFLSLFLGRMGGGGGAGLSSFKRN